MKVKNSARGSRNQRVVSVLDNIQMVKKYCFILRLPQSLSGEVDKHVLQVGLLDALFFFKAAF